ncbi:hypothetical protein [Desulfosoma sp.]|uniref:hypothetical protein n=1 Tax=Desulfosoma sp. TaxID=2603217 RepID=UPI00404AEF03
MSPYRFKALRAKLDLPQVGERVRSKRYGTVWKIIEEIETWIPVPAHLRGLWFPDGKNAGHRGSLSERGQRQGPGTGKTMTHRYSQADPSFQEHWEVFYDW